MTQVKEEHVRPKKLFDKYLQLAEEDAVYYFNGVEQNIIKCPVCRTAGRPVFQKNKFNYDLCPSCLSLYVNPRPTFEAFERYYIGSKSSQFWATTFYKETETERREKLWAPKAKSLLALLDKYGHSKSHIVDIGGGFGLFADEIRRIGAKSVTIVEPSPKLAEICRNKSHAVVEKFLEHIDNRDLPDGPKVLTSFELFEHLHDPVYFLSCLSEIMNRGDIFVFTTLSSQGLDIQVLWERSKSVMPPHHLNFFNPASIKLLLKNNGLDTLEVTTPGVLDIDILENNLTFVTDRFWKNFINTATESQKQVVQRTISEAGFSSHMMVLARKL